VTTETLTFLSATEVSEILGVSSRRVRQLVEQGKLEGSSRDTIAAFKQVLDRARIPATVRLTRGRDIAAACGQLAATR
jgi:adenine C2-methylase RlmN of 23S rRNA A2503 and tRNA A37